MAGHSQFKNIMYRKSAQDAKKARAFAKIGREILVAAKTGLPDPQSNPRLRAALMAARAVNMPNDNINRILKKAAGGEDTAVYEAVRYEGFGTGGVSVIVEALTDNRNRTFSEVRLAFTKFGGNLGESGSVSFQFEHVGRIAYPTDKTTFDSLFELAVEAGASDVREADDEFEIICPVETFGQIRDILMEKLGDPTEAGIIWSPINTVDCTIETMRTLLKMIDMLEDNDDVQHVFTNLQCSEEVQQKLSEEM